MGDNLEKILAKIEQKECFDTKQFFVSHNEDHAYQGVLVNNRTVRFHISPNADTAKFIDFILDFDVSDWGDIAEEKLVKKYEEVSKKFDAECDKIPVGARIEINYDKDLRALRIKKELEKKHGVIQKDSSECPLIYYPFGFAAYSSGYTRERAILPEVVSVRLINKNERPKTSRTY